MSTQTMTFVKGDKVRVKHRHGELCIRAPFAGGKYEGEGFWVWSYQLGRVVPALTVDIRRTR